MVSKARFRQPYTPSVSNQLLRPGNPCPAPSCVETLQPHHAVTVFPSMSMIAVYNALVPTSG